MKERPIPSLTEAELVRYWSKVNRTPGCWLWTASTNNGYGQFRAAGTMVLAHRVSWLLCHGVSPAMSVLHRCDTPRCVNPAHLFLGTQADNMRDMAAKRRSTLGAKNSSHLYPERRARGERNGQAKLTAAVVNEARARHANGESQRSLARLFGVSQMTLRSAIIGTTWRDV